jgi:carbamoyltransferase
MRTIIGLNLYHADSSAALIQDGRVLGAIAEERLGDRVKHTSQFPLNAIKTLLSQHKIGLAEVDAIAIARDENANLNAKIKWSL